MSGYPSVPSSDGCLQSRRKKADQKDLQRIADQEREHTGGKSFEKIRLEIEHEPESADRIKDDGTKDRSRKKGSGVFSFFIEQATAIGQRKITEQETAGHTE